MKKLLPIVFLVGCAQFQEQGTAQQDRELANNLAEVMHAEREICRQIRADTAKTLYPDPSRWHAFCDYTGVAAP